MAKSVQVCFDTPAPICGRNALNNDVRLRFTGKGVIYEDEACGFEKVAKAQPAPVSIPHMPTRHESGQVERYSIYFVGECNNTLEPVFAPGELPGIPHSEAVKSQNKNSVMVPALAMGIESGTRIYGLAVRVLIRKPKTLELSEHYWEDRVDPITNGAPSWTEAVFLKLLPFMASGGIDPAVLKLPAPRHGADRCKDGGPFSGAALQATPSQKNPGLAPGSGLFWSMPCAGLRSIFLSE
ncbi:hypothetical protein AK812_SmicGene8866 [Symbiodinium microadriaticum]|uniref:Uncharacterized protein n=1 Tax=Symbiodinium microadriaticum TaxID=2951 RepID=A0A1Q9EJT2_SYMMI|nr:hypothetical protein AK812_SmicGene8866 [Symbiodinium microadriaticum]